MKTTRMVSLDTSSTISGYAYWENAILTKSGILYHDNEKDTLIRIEDMTIPNVKYCPYCGEPLSKQ